MRYRFGYSSDSIENMTRWELDIELALISQDIEQKNLAKSQ